jgi:hypothetical protein
VGFGHCSCKADESTVSKAHDAVQQQQQEQWQHKVFGAALAAGQAGTATACLAL